MHINSTRLLLAYLCKEITWPSKICICVKILLFILLGIWEIKPNPVLMSTNVQHGANLSSIKVRTQIPKEFKCAQIAQNFKRSTWYLKIGLKTLLLGILPSFALKGQTSPFRFLNVKIILSFLKAWQHNHFTYFIVLEILKKYRKHYLP